MRPAAARYVRSWNRPQLGELIGAARELLRRGGDLLRRGAGLLAGRRHLLRRGRGLLGDRGDAGHVVLDGDRAVRDALDRAGDLVHPTAHVRDAAADLHEGRTGLFDRRHSVRGTRGADLDHIDGARGVGPDLLDQPGDRSRGLL
jgi:hypothetical protein